MSYYYPPLRTNCSSKEEVFLKLEKLYLGKGYVKDGDGIYKKYENNVCVSTVTIKTEE